MSWIGWIGMSWMGWDGTDWIGLHGMRWIESDGMGLDCIALHYIALLCMDVSGWNGM